MKVLLRKLPGWVLLGLLVSINARPGVAISNCATKPARVAIDIGHSPRRFGVTSARGAREFDFNHRFAEEFIHQTRSEPRLDAFLISPQSREIALRKRVELANASRARIFLSIHHDSAQRSLLTAWEYNGRKLLKTDTIGGFSLFVSRDNPHFVKSRRIARFIAHMWLHSGHPRTLHHAADLTGERRELLDRQLGIYEAPFAVIKRTRIPAVLVEVGVLVNPREETWLSQRKNRKRLQTALVQALTVSLCSDTDPTNNLDH